MDQELQSQILKVIEEQLPKQVGEALQRRLNEADEIEKRNIALQEHQAMMTKKVSRLNDEIASLMMLKNDAEEIKERERVVCDAEVKLTVGMLEVRLNAEKRVTSALMDILANLTKNTVYREETMKSYDHIYSGDVTIPMEHSCCKTKTTE